MSIYLSVINDIIEHKTIVKQHSKLQTHTRQA